MYETLEFYNSDGLDLKDILKDCIYNYFIKNINHLSTDNKLKSNENNSIINMTSKQEILSSERRLNV